MRKAQQSDRWIRESPFAATTPSRLRTSNRLLRMAEAQAAANGIAESVLRNPRIHRISLLPARADINPGGVRSISSNDGCVAVLVHGQTHIPRNLKPFAGTPNIDR
jgi:hypothetical protein